MTIVKNYTKVAEAFQKSRPGLEAINFQYDKLFHLELVESVRVIREGKGKASAISKSKIHDIVMKHLGIKIALNIREDYHGACTTVPSLNKSHPLINDYMRGGWEDDNALERLAKSDKGVLKGEIDLAKSKVSGIFSEIEMRVFLGSKLFDKAYKYSDEEIAAILCHELGHTFSYFELLAHATTTNVIIRSSMERLIGNPNREQRIAIIESVESAIGAKFDDRDRLIDTKSKDVYQTVVLAKATEASRSEMGENIYDYTGFEAMADQFATRHGFTSSLATALDKINRHYGSDSYRGRGLFIFLEAGKLLLFIASIATGNIIFPVLVLLTNPFRQEYDKPGQRTKRIRGQVVEALKEKNLPDDQRDSLLNDLTVIDNLSEDINDKSTILEMYWGHINPIGRRQRKSINFQQDLEELVQNDLIVAAAKLQQAKG